jgi:uncharacterized protein (TIGR00369 family)
MSLSQPIHVNGFRPCLILSDNRKFRPVRNAAGYIQGGILSAMLDDTMGPAVFVKTEGRLYTATISMSISFLAAAQVGPIVGEANVVQLGKTIAFIEGKLIDETGRLLATATANARLVEAVKALG